MAHNRKLAFSGIALTKARIPPKPNAVAANRVRDELEGEIVASGFLEAAPFLRHAKCWTMHTAKLI